MKNKLSLLGFAFISILTYAQTGIYTSNPQNTFHVDGGKDNPVTGVPSPAQQANDFIITNTGSTGIGTNTPDASALLDITSNNKGLLVPRIALSSRTDATTITSPATGLILYNTATGGTGGDQINPGLVTNTGTSANPTWASVQVVSNIQGHTTDKLRYLGLPNIAKTTTVDSFLEFRVRQSGPNYLFEMRLLNPPTSNIIYRYARVGYNTVANNGLSSSFTFTPANYNVWQTVDNPSITTGVVLGFHGVLSTSARDALHELILHFSYGEFVNCAINTY